MSTVLGILSSRREYEYLTCTYLHNAPVRVQRYEDEYTTSTDNDGKYEYTNSL